MIESYVKYFFMLICTFYCFSRLLNLSMSRKKYLINVGAFLLSDILICLTRFYMPHMVVIILAAIIFVQASITHNTTSKITLITSILSVGLNYIFFIISVLITSPILFFIVSKAENYKALYIFFFVR